MNLDNKEVKLNKTEEVVIPGTQEVIVITTAGKRYRAVSFEEIIDDSSEPVTNEPSPVTIPVIDGTLFNAPQQVDGYVSSNPQLQVLKDTPTAAWINGDSDIPNKIVPYSEQARQNGETPVFVLYNAIARNPEGGIDGSVSDGAGTLINYKNWIDAIKANVKTKSIFIVEPDAIPRGIDIGNNKPTLKYAVDTLSAAGHDVYVDVGHDQWLDSDGVAAAVVDIIENARGISLNVSNFGTTEDNIRFGTEVIDKLHVSGKKMVIDTGRNGAGRYTGEGQNWCNPPGRKIGEKPVIGHENPLVDALLWIKPPGESDGTCNGGPSAGLFWTEYALGLVS